MMFSNVRLICYLDIMLFQLKIFDQKWSLFGFLLFIIIIYYSWYPPTAYSIVGIVLIDIS